MRDLNESDSASLFPIVVIALAFVIAKVLAKLGIANKKNVNLIANIMALSAGTFYAANFEVVRSFGSAVDFFLRISFGAIVGGVLWVFFVIGIGAAISDEDAEK